MPANYRGIHSVIMYIFQIGDNINFKILNFSFINCSA